LYHHYYQIAEVDGNGRILRVYGGLRGDGTQQLDEPSYLALDSAGNVLVSDTGHGRLLFIAWNTTKRLERTVLLMKDKRELYTKPHRFCRNASNGLLVISSANGMHVNFYSLAAASTNVYNLASFS